ncbi:MAG: alanine:cation symporter family protein [Acidaminococcaceae bacterium]|nr:alanine:cation symporter family protein [Acidaminococcaceae bacterium]
MALLISVFCFLPSPRFLAGAITGEKCCEYILGSKAVKPYRIVYSLAVFLGAVVELQIVWNIAGYF